MAAEDSGRECRQTADRDRCRTSRYTVVEDGEDANVSDRRKIYGGFEEQRATHSVELVGSQNLGNLNELVKVVVAVELR